ANAERGETLLRVAALHLVDQRRQNASTGCADRMTDGNGATVHVDLIRIPANTLVHRARLCSESLVGFDDVEVLGCPARLLQRLRGSRYRAGSHDGGINASMGPGNNTGKRLDTALLGFGSAHEHHSGSTVIDARRVAGSHGAGLVERRAQLGNALQRSALADVLVLVDDRIALLALDGDSDDLVLELAGLLRGLDLVLRREREVVLILAADLPLTGDVLSSGAHVVVIESIPEAVLDHRIDERDVAQL